LIRISDFLGADTIEFSASGTKSRVIVRTMRPLERWSLGRVANCRGTRLHAPMARPTGATPFVSSKHVIVAVTPRVRTCVRATTVTTRCARDPRVVIGYRDTGEGMTWRVLDLCLLTLKIGRFPHARFLPHRRVDATSGAV